MYCEAHSLVDSVLEESVAIVNTQLTNSNGANHLVAVRAPGINVIVKSPTLESLVSRSFDEVVVVEPAPKPAPPKPKRRFVYTDSKDSEEEKVDETASKVDRKFERLSSDVEIDSSKQFDETFAEIKDEASELQNEFSKMSFGDSTNSTGDFGSNTPDNDLQGE